MLNKLFKYALPAILIICAAALCFKAMIEPDTWWQLAAGRYILHHGPVTHDVFSYTYYGKPWMNIKWGYEVIAYIYASFLGAEMLPVLQWLITLCMLYVFTKIISHLNKTLNITTNKGINTLVLLAGMCGMAYRFNARPESITHLFTVLFIGLNYHRIATGSKRTMYVLIALQLLWANMHDAFVMGWVVTGAFALSYVITSKSFVKTFKEYGLLLLGQIAIIAINPYGFKLLIQPLNTFSQFSTNTFTYELLDYTHSAWWTPEAYLAFALFGILVLCKVWLWFTDKTYWLHSLSVMWPLYLLFLAFMYLGLKAQRNIVFIFIPLIPIIAVHLSHIFKQRFTIFIGGLTLLSGIALWIWVASGYFYKDLYKRSEFGLYINTDSNPVGAAQYIVNNHLEGKHFFTDYLSSSYLMYGAKGLKTYVDLRDQDVFPDTFIANSIKQATIPEEFAKADSFYHFDGVVLLRNQFKALHSYLYNSKRYYVRYGDNNTLIYIKGNVVDSTVKNEPDGTIMTSFSVQICDRFSQQINNKQNLIAKICTRLINPSFMLLTTSYKVVSAHEYYSDVGDKTALTENLKDNKNAPAPILNMLQAEIYYDSSLIVKDSLAKLPYLNLTRSLLLKSYNADSKDVQVNIDLYTYYTHVQKLDSALYYAQQAYNNNKYDAFAISTLASACVSAANAQIEQEENYSTAISLYKKLLHYTPDDPTTLFNIGSLYLDLHDDKGKDYLQQALDTKQLTTEQEQSARELMKN